MKKLIFIYTLLLLVCAAHAQYGEIDGKVKDERIGGLPFSKVIIVDSAGTAIGKGVTTDADGNYSLRPLMPGRYNLQYSSQGYISQTEKSIIVSKDKATFVDATLKQDPNAPVKNKRKKRSN